MKRKVIIFLFGLLLPFFLGFRVFADDLSEEISKLEDRINELQGKISQTQQQAATLTNQITYMNSEIQLTELRISQTLNRIELVEAQVEDLGRKIGVLDKSLNDVSVLFINRVIATYKAGQISPLDLFLSSNRFGDFFSRWKYFQLAQLNDREMLLAMEQMRADYDQRKAEKEEKQLELENLKAQLDSQKNSLDLQKREKAHLLEVTRNDEREYQRLLSQVRAEYEAIQAILAGKGTEAEVGEVGAGERIASVIPGSSCNSSGTHLHFTVKKDGQVVNPFNYLKSVDHVNDSGDTFNPSGDWDWPLQPPIRMTQGYGNTWAISNTWVGRYYSFHTGVDIVSTSLSVYSVDSGTLYRGSYTGVGGCKLPYVRLDHKDSDITTLYLHINYTSI